VREAIGLLKHDGLVTTRQGAGVFVTEGRVLTSFRLDNLDFGNKAEIRHIIKLSRAVESAATRLAALRRNPMELAAAEAQLLAMQAAIDRGDPVVEEDVAFHRVIIEVSGNPIFS
jgi:DNA-binding FadR family transcriptional regulator